MAEKRTDLTSVAEDAAERIEALMSNQAGTPVGLDVGTSKIVSSWPQGKGVETRSELNAFIPVPFSRFTQRTLDQQNVSYFQEGEELVIYGNAAEKFANMFNANARRPMADGLLNPKEKLAMPVIEAIFERMIPKARVQGEPLAFSVPAAVEGHESQLTFHEGTLRRLFESRGYRAIAINEGLAVIFSELEDQNFTGIGISCGGGMCNVTLAYLSIPSIMFSIPKGGDYIDQNVGSVVNEHATRIRVLKEEGLDLSRPANDKYERPLHIYYEDLVESLVEALHRSVSKAEKLPKSDRPLTIVLAGGTAKPKGFREMFEKALKARPMPIEIAGVRMASDPLTATARGALIAAQYEK